MTFELSYSFLEDWKITSTSDFLGSDGWVWQEFKVGGEFSFIDFELLSLFGPVGPAFLYTQLTFSFSIAALDVTVYSAYVGPDIPGVYFSGGPSGGAVTVISTEVDDVALEIEAGFGAQLTGLTITYIGVGTFTKSYPVDPFPGGLEFTYFKLTANDIPFLCCGLTLDVAFSFTKLKGFEYVKFVLKDLFNLCCDISLDVTLAFYTTAKEVSLKPHWGGIEGCVTVYGDLQFTHSIVEGWELYGFKIFCQLEECYGIEFLTAFNVAAVEGIIGDVFEGDEFEYVKLTACGPACCDGTWDLAITVFFQDLSGPLFGVSRFVIDVSVPLMENLTITTSFEIAIPGGPSLDLGWEFSF
jgi:hypothetical protein